MIAAPIFGRLAGFWTRRRKRPGAIFGQGELPDDTYVAVVGLLYATLTPNLIIAVGFLGVSARVAADGADIFLMLAIAAGSIAVLARLGTLLLYRAEASAEGLQAAGAARLERIFAIPYLAFAVAFGAFSARAMQVASTESHILVVALVFGYAAGVAAGIFVRPWIALPSIVIGVAPTSLVALLKPEPTYVGIGLLLLLFLAGGIHSMMRTYRGATSEITARRVFTKLARADALTGLDNRLSLREAFENSLLRVGRDGTLSVHCLDLDRFKAVNDNFGHPVGDELLRAVADRLRRLLRTGDVAARVGGDEFVLLQASAQHPGEADLLARRIARAIAEPYSIRGHQLSIATSVGYAVRPQHGRDLDELIARADDALIRVKREGGGVALYAPAAPAGSAKAIRTGGR